MDRTVLASTILATLLAALVSIAGAQDFPGRPIRLVVPFAPGGGTDIVARILADPLTKALGQTVVVDNRGGAASIIGSDIVSKSAPDGHTLLMGTISLATNAAIYKKLPFDLQRDLAPITRTADQPNIVVVHPSLPASSFKEFLSLTRSQPGKLTFGSPGHGTGLHLATELLFLKINAALVHVPFKGTGPALTALLGGEISVYLSTFASALPHVKSSRLRPYAVTTLKRAGPLPDVPTLAEEGVRDYEYAAWYGLFAPSGTPSRIIEQLNNVTVAALNSPEVRRTFDAQGLNSTPTTAAEFAKYIDSERKKWASVVRDAKIAQQ